ncbi:MAG: hypothetical protein ACI8TX_000877 [Hyphomicrobiaceae bacterium]|jgi:hypothetical protein
MTCLLNSILALNLACVAAFLSTGSGASLPLRGLANEAQNGAPSMFTGPDNTHHTPESGPRSWFGPALAISLAFVFAVVVPSPAQAGGKPTAQVLLIGNSFTKGVKRDLKKILKERGYRAKVTARARNGATLNVHARSKSTYKAIARKQWDWVVLQEQSLGTFHVRYPDARALDAAVKAEGLQTAFFMTWRDRGWELITYDSLRGEIGDDVGYVPIANELNATIAPVGWAWRTSVAENTPIDLWKSDGHHANSAGNYLAAMVLYASLYQDSPIGLKPGKKLASAQADYLQSLADRTVFADPNAWNIGS